eukprot:CAMPEP_0116876212 /NCGR_PEP_ID=MMETSP0463-20121206/8210_1 /TAXON_ID=181622 /ORGANISM="Strombidinopsis sp, Strain SopsisLIS2011" /LENGTH=261 /DNA_ID=CAMNT_0004522703 /DNA_START=457 /DNA_END=1242 /DNA_ORIENTATION=+
MALPKKKGQTMTTGDDDNDDDDDDDNLFDDNIMEQLLENLESEMKLIIDEMETIHEEVTRQAVDHINDNDVILTYSSSNLLLSFFEHAHDNGCSFEVIVAESAPHFNGHKTAKQLAKKGIQTNLVQDSAIFAVMSRVNKVFVSAHAIMATGGLVAQTGALMIAHAAKAHSVPVFAVAAQYKLTPLYPIDSNTYNELLSPETIFRLEEGDVEENIEAIVPAYDYVPPKLVSLILTNIEGYTPENIYRAFNELFGRNNKLHLE